MITVLKRKDIKGSFPIRWNQIKQYKSLYLMALPAIISYFIFSYVPLFGWIMAFINYKPGKSIIGSEFVGLKNFEKFFSASSGYSQVLLNTVGINVLSLIAIFALAIVFSIMLSEVKKKFGRIVQMVSLFPFFMSWIIACSLVYAMFGLQSGAVNVILVNLGIIKEGVNVLGDPKYAWILMITLNVWKSLGYYSIIFLATIVGIPAEEYEAASIDGASRWKKILYVTLPNLKQVFFVMMILQCGTIFNSGLDQYFAFTNSQNWDSMITFDMYIYTRGFAKGDFSYATAVGIIKTVVSLIMVISVNKLSRKYAETSVL